jgi:hypothetical protein
VVPPLLSAPRSVTSPYTRFDYYAPSSEPSTAFWVRELDWKEWRHARVISSVGDRAWNDITLDSALGMCSTQQGAVVAKTKARLRIRVESTDS